MFTSVKEDQQRAEALSEWKSLDKQRRICQERVDAVGYRLIEIRMIELGKFITRHAPPKPWQLPI